MVNFSFLYDYDIESIMEIKLSSSESKGVVLDNDVKSKVLSILCQFGEINYRNDDVFFKEDGLLDSIKMLRFFMQIQNEFNIKFSPNDIKDNQVYELNSLVNFISKRLL